MKQCYSCGETKSLEDFHKRTAAKDGRQGKCKVCAIKQMQSWKLTHPEQYKKNNDYRTINLSKHGLTVDQWDGILDCIDYKCQICGAIMDKPYVDHDHLTGLVRGALCTHCNRGLGAFYDSPELLQKAIEFLENPPLANLEVYSRVGKKAETTNSWMPGRNSRSKKK